MTDAIALWNGFENFAGDQAALQLDGLDRAHLSVCPARDEAPSLPDAQWIAWQNAIAAAPAMLAALQAAEYWLDEDQHAPGQTRPDDILRTIRAAIASAEGHEVEAAPDPYEAAARAAGWQHGGDGDGFWFDGKVYDSWKAAASWSGEDGEDSPTYDTAREVCDGEGLAPLAVTHGA